MIHELPRNRSQCNLERTAELKILSQLNASRGLILEGRLTRMVGLTLEAVGCRAAIGGQCDVSQLAVVM